ncbi:tail fiber domain-containing protein [Lacrimispora sp.]|uniref:tail fiber domain-containing protein n=1 Tax=Lacrimispora sp. TaxID=2719234 RepID=UPI0028A913C3|nr:tail fiber domain-containing protein [Lacrimispora sp.]
MLSIPEEIKALYRADNSNSETVRLLKLRFYDDAINLIYPSEELWPSDDLFPVDDTPLLLVGEDQITYESLSINQMLCSSESLTFGECNASNIEITVADVTMDVTGKEFTLSVEVGGYEMMMGIYKVDSFERQADRRLRKIVAYDRMLNFDVDVSGWYRGLIFPMSLKQYRNSLCDFIGIRQKEITLPLDNMEVTRSIDPSKLSGRDAMKAICEINGCFGQIDITGKFKYVFLGASGLFPSEELYPADDLFPSQMEGENLSHYKPSGTTYEDFLVYGIDKVQIRQEEGDIGASYGAGTNTYTIQGNFLAYGKSAQELLNIAANVHNNISRKVYRPCKIVTQALPWVEPGDGIICYTSDDVIETYCLKRTIKGIQAMMDTFEASGTRERRESFGIGTQIIQLEGKTAVIKKSVEEVSVRVTDLKAETEAQFKITADNIIAEVTRAQQAEALLSIRADQIALSVTNLANNTNSRFEQTAQQILLKVSKGDVSSQLSIEPGDVIIKTNRLSWESDFSSMTNDGKLTCRNINAINGSFSGRLATSVFYADNDLVRFGDYQVSANGTGTLMSANGLVNITDTFSSGPLNEFASLTVGSDSRSDSVSIKGTGDVETARFRCRQDYYFEDRWTEGMGALDMFKQVYNRLDAIRYSIQNMGGNVDWD